MRLPRARWLAAVLAVLLLAEGGARLIDGHIPETDERGHPELEYKWDLAAELTAGDAPPRTVAFGNSMLDGAFIPETFTAAGGEPAFNAGFLNAPLSVIDDWAGLVIERTRPDTAIVVVHPLDTVEGDVSFGQDGGTLAPSFDDALSRIDPGAFDRLTDRAAGVSALVRNRSTIRQPRELWQAVEATIGDEEPPAPQRIDEAAPLHEVDWAAALDPRGWNTRFQDGALPPDASFPFLEDLIGELTTQELDAAPVVEVLRAMAPVEQAVLVIPPVADEVLERSGIPAAFLDQRTADLIALAEDVDVDVVDLSGAEYPTSLFHDPVHLNRAGAERFSRDLATALSP